MKRSAGFRIAAMVLFSAAVAALALAVANRKDDPTLPRAERTHAPVWELRDVNGQAVRSSDFKGKVVVLDFWATWCPPCLAELPGFIEIQRKYATKGVVVIGVSLDEEGAAVLKPFIQQHKLNYTVLVGTEKISEAFKIESIPTTFILDGEGRIASQHVGFTEQALLETAIKKVLRE